MNFYGLNDMGIKQKFQEDSFYGFERNDVLFLIVSDGMGSKEGLDSSSIITINQIVTYIERFFPTGQQFNINQLKNLIDGALFNANRELIAYKIANPNLYQGLAATCTMCAITKNKEIIITHIGNSRLYILRNNNIYQITKDHTECQDLLDQNKITKEDARLHPKRHVLTKCLGIKDDFKYDCLISKVSTNDLLLLCTDGVYDVLFDEEIKNVILEAKDSKTACEWLIQGANQRGGYDNITSLLSFINF